MKLKNLFKGAAAIVAILLILSICGATVLYDNGGIVNNYLGITTGEIVSDNPDGEDLQYYKSDYGDGTFSQENLELLIKDIHTQNVSEVEEGCVLLKNDGTLPLKESDRSVALFGQYINAPVDIGDSSDAIDLKTALKESAFTVDGAAKTAIVMISRSGGEGQEFSMVNKDGISSLAFQKDEQELLRSVKTSAKYDSIIVLINSSNPIELEWLYDKEFGVSAALWIGGPGQIGFRGVVNLLTGKSNPSGKLTDTYAVVSTSAPACVNGSCNSPRYENVDYLKQKSKETASSIAYYSVQAENIYLGYKYYETRYEDCVLGRYGANSSVGSSFDKNWDYADEVTYPFGYGLSYTTFSQAIENVEKNENGYELSVKVKNVGDVAGKSVVQVYAQTPYGDYEMANLVEKSAVSLVGFSKTKLLLPDEEVTIKIVIDEYFLASYDYVSAKGYILSAGDYYLAIGDDCHDALNNVLAAKGVTGTFDQRGLPVRGDLKKVYKTTIANADFERYRYGENDCVVTNKFEDCDINYWIKNAATYLSRQDWEGTYPKERVSVSITDEMIEVINGETYQKPADAPDYEKFLQGIDGGITAFEMTGIPYEDEKWETFLNQLTMEETASIIAGDFSKDQIDSLVLPSYLSGDGIDRLSASYRNDEKGRSCFRYANEIVLASTWNADLAKARGNLTGEEMLFCGYFQIYGPGADLHRTPFGGRNKEYCSEDANLTYLITAELVKGFREKNVGVQIKHLAGNDQEFNRSGISLFFTEQAWREGSLRGFEGAIRKGSADGCMNGLNRVGLRWTNSSEALCNGILRQEWGFIGVIGSDGIASKYQTHFTTSLAAGTDSYCLDGKGRSSAAIVEYLNANKDGYILLKLREAAKRNLYRLVNSSVMNGLNENSQIVYQRPWWKTAVVTIITVLSLLEVVFVAFYFIVKFKKAGEKNED